VTFENALTSTQRAKVLGWFRSTPVGRVVQNGKILCVGTPWHPQDLLRELERSNESPHAATLAKAAAGVPNEEPVPIASFSRFAESGAPFHLSACG
jgi:hypothetical protein